MPRLQHASLTCEAEQAAPLRTRNPSPPLWRRGRGASLYQCSAAGGAHPGRRSPAQCRTKPRCPSLLCRPRRVTSPGKVASHRRARGFGRAAARGGHCELTLPGARGRREMSTFGDTSSQVQRRGGALRVNTSRHTGTARDKHLRWHLIAGPLLQRDEAAQPTAHVLCRGGRTGPRHGSPRVLVPHAPSQNTTPWARSTALPEDRRAPAPCCGGRGPETSTRLTGRRPASQTAAPVLLLLSAYYIGAAAAAAATAPAARPGRARRARFGNRHRKLGAHYFDEGLFTEFAKCPRVGFDRR